MTSSSLPLEATGGGGDTVDGELAGRGIADDAALANVLATGFKLRLDQED